MESSVYICLHAYHAHANICLANIYFGISLFAFSLDLDNAFGAGHPHYLKCYLDLNLEHIKLYANGRYCRVLGVIPLFDVNFYHELTLDTFLLYFAFLL